MDKIEDFGVHFNSYYSVEISYFKSDLDSGMLDLLWNKYWVNTLSSSPLLATRDLTASQISDIGTDHFSFLLLPLKFIVSNFHYHRFREFLSIRLLE